MKKQANSMAHMGMLLDLAVRSACNTFDVFSPVRRLELRADPRLRSRFVLRARLVDGRLYEGTVSPVAAAGRAAFHFDWCMVAGCHCSGFAAGVGPGCSATLDGD